MRWSPWTSSGKPVPAFLKFFGAVERAPAIDGWLDAQPGLPGSAGRRCFAPMRRWGADVRERTHDGCPTVCVEDAALAHRAIVAMLRFAE